MSMLTFEQYNNEKYTDFNVWKAAVEQAEPKAIVTLEDGSSHYYMASKSGTAQMIGKFQLSGDSKTKGSGYLYPKYATLTT